MKILTCSYLLVAVPKDPIFWHSFIIFSLIVAFLLFFGIYPKSKPAGEPIAMKIGECYQDLNRRIFASKSMQELLKLRPLIDGFDNAQFYGSPDKCMRKALRASLMSSFSRKLKEVSALV